MSWLITAVLFLVASGSVLAMAEAALSRMNRVHALALQDEQRRNAGVLVRIEEDPTRYLNTVYLAVMFAQNGSAILVAIISERLFGEIWVSVASLVFTLAYFVSVEAMSKTYAILHNDRVALAVAPVVWLLARALFPVTRLLIGLANFLLPGKGLKEGPFVSEETIRSMADVGHEEGAIEEEEREMIHSIFELGDTVVREVMVPRPDMVVVSAQKPIRKAMELAMEKGFSRIPVIDKDPDDIVGVVYAKDMFRAVTREGANKTVAEVMRRAYFVPDAKKVGELLREMQKNRVHMAIVSDEFGDVAGLVTLEDLIEEIVGEIADEYDKEDPEIVPLGDHRWRVKARMTIDELNELLGTQLPNEEWDTVGGLLMNVLGKLPTQGEEVSFQGLKLRAEKMQGRRIVSVLITKQEEGGDERERHPA